MKSLMLRALACEDVERRPLWVMRQAGRYLPEYRALRKEKSFEQLCADSALAAEVTMMPLRRFTLDAGIIFADLMSPLAALGVDFHFDPGPVMAEPVRSAEQVRALRRPEPAEIAPEVPEAIRQVKAQLGEETALLGFAGAPLSLAAYLVEGQGSKGGFPNLRAMIWKDPTLFGDLMERLARLAADYLIEQARAGADAVQVFDTWAGLISRTTWEAHVRPHLVALLEEIGRAGVPRILFINDAPHLMDAIAGLPFEALACDWRLELGAVKKLVGESRAVQGNLDPAVLHAGPEATVRATRELLSGVPQRGHVVNLGHGITPEAPIESVQALIETVHAEKADR